VVEFGSTHLRAQILARRCPRTSGLSRGAQKALAEIASGRLGFLLDFCVGKQAVIDEVEFNAAPGLTLLEVNAEHASRRRR
jgi:hypothetical protein